MKTFFSKNARLIAMIFAIVVGLMLIVTATFMLTDYQDEISDRALSRSQYNASISSETFKDSMDEYNIHTASIASTAATFKDSLDLNDYLSSKSLTTGQEAPIDSIKDIRFYKNGVMYTTLGNVYEQEDPSLDHYKNNYDKVGYIGDYEDSDKVMTLVGFYAPVYNSTLLDAVVVYYTVDTLKNFYSPEQASELREFSILVDDEGNIIIGDTKDTEVLNIYNAYVGNIYNTLQSVLGKKTPADELKHIVDSKEDGAMKISMGTEDCVIAVSTDSEVMPGLAIIELYKVSVLCESGLAFVNTIISIIVIFTVVVLSLIIYLFIYNWSIRRKLLNLSTTNPLLQCNNRVGFERQAKEILDRNRNSYFACMVLEIRHFSFIQETTNEAELNSVLRFIRYALSKVLMEEECYGYADNGEFLLLLHAKDREGLVNRLKVFNSVVSKNRIANKLDVLIKYGIYEVDVNEKITISKMLDYGREANNTVVKKSSDMDSMLFNFYDVELRKIRLINEDMELRMESALKNGEFQVFYQPKFNLNLGRQDGAEALVRWYDKDTGVYNRPDLFMALFESNGFVVKIDKYVFERVCEYISYSIAHGRTVYPISVNISRVTAIQPDFVDYYGKIKRKYGISDGQIMIEFTESFAYENYKTLYDIVEGLHKAGFKCSIDDFGCGYSSYRILKSLPMDEIKLDKFFIERGLSEERDNSIFDSIIRLGKKLKMKVTQEGVEHQEGVDLLREMGCDVIQGYIYARPMALSDYIKFVQTTREHDLK